MKMSPRNTFRLFALSLSLVLSLIDAPVHSFTLSRLENLTESIYDLDQEESIKLEVRNDLRRPNDIELTKGDNLIITTETYVKDNFIPTVQGPITDGSPDISTSINLNTHNESEATISSFEDDHTFSGHDKHTHVSYNVVPSEAKQLPSWKKYTIINRKSNGNEQKDVSLESNKTESMITDETGLPRQDSKSGDIPSLNQIKNFLFPSSFFKSEVQNDTSTTVETTGQSVENTETTNEPITNTGSPATVESKRGGFLDFSLKSLFEDNSDKKDSSQENNNSKPKGRRLSWRFGSRYRGKEDSSAEKSKERSRFRFRNNKDRKTDGNNTVESKEEYSKELESKEYTDKSLSHSEKNNENNRENIVLKNGNTYPDEGNIENSTMLYDNKENKQESSEENSDSSSKKDKETRNERKDNERTKEKARNERINESKEKNSENKKTLQKESNNYSSNSRNSKEDLREDNKSKEYVKERKVKTTTEINIWKTNFKLENSQSPFKYTKDTSAEKENNDESLMKIKNNEKIEIKSKEGSNESDDDRSQSRKRTDKGNSSERYNDRRINNRNEKYNSRTQNDKQDNDFTKKSTTHKNNNILQEKIYKNDYNDSISHKNIDKGTTGMDYSQEFITKQYMKIEDDRKPVQFENEKIKTPETIEQNDSRTQNIEPQNLKQDYNNSQKPITIEYIKQYLSTIDEEDESATQVPVTEKEITTAKLKEEDVPNIVAVKYPSDFKINDMDTTPGTFEPYEPYRIPNLLISLPKPINKNEEQKSLQVNERKLVQDKSIKELEENMDKHDQKNHRYVEQTTENMGFGTGENNRNENKNIKQTGVAIQLNEDARKEELLEEEIINNYAENFGKYNEYYRTTTQAIIPVKIYEISKKTEAKENNTLDEKLSVKPLSFFEKLKTTILYPVGANYKPPKKIEVQPPKPFVRDPDDNSWRNESLSSLGIVFKPKNSSKPFTQVLKNKTESEWSNLLEKQNKNETPDLRERLEKIAELRKTKKKKTDADGNVLYNDYEESYSRELLSKGIESSTSTMSTSAATTATAPTTVAPLLSTSTQTSITEPGQNVTVTKSTTKKPKKVFNVAEYYDTSDEDDADYLTLAKIDLKKFTVPYKNTDSYVTPPTWPVTNLRFGDHQNYDRKPTLQYFPPLTTQKGMYKDYDNDFRQKLGALGDTEPPTNVLPVSYTKQTTSIPKTTQEELFTPRTILDTFLTTKSNEFEKDRYMTHAPELAAEKDGYTYVTDDGSFNRAADVIKHYRDFLSAVAKDHDNDKNMEDYGPYPYTKTPLQGVTVSDVMIDHKIKSKQEMVEGYDYENDFRKDVLQRFVHNFNQNSERFKSDLPLLYNNSIIHGSQVGGRDVASSRAFLSRMLSRPSADCDNSTMELSPAYELHYYVPEQEEKEEIVPKSVTPPYQYRI